MQAMSFFTKYNGTTNARLLRMERLVWPLMYAGLLALVLGWFTANSQGGQDAQISALALYVGGTLALGLGLLLFYLRSRHPGN